MNAFDSGLIVFINGFTFVLSIVLPRKHFLSNGFDITQ
ncbi:hypothetical protein ykris0001_44540 [Yersinia kristensenii ATCC 33638]|nr:hypothetical protein ykris0001_44540 [Yersinia kristensenii ATCC 33638]